MSRKPNIKPPSQKPPNTVYKTHYAKLPKAELQRALNLGIIDITNSPAMQTFKVRSHEQRRQKILADAELVNIRKTPRIQNPKNQHHFVDKLFPNGEIQVVEPTPKISVGETFRKNEAPIHKAQSSFFSKLFQHEENTNLQLEHLTPLRKMAVDLAKIRKVPTPQALDFFRQDVRKIGKLTPQNELRALRDLHTLITNGGELTIHLTENELLKGQAALSLSRAELLKQPTEIILARNILHSDKVLSKDFTHQRPKQVLINAIQTTILLVKERDGIN